MSTKYNFQVGDFVKPNSEYREIYYSSSLLPVPPDSMGIVIDMQENEVFSYNFSLDTATGTTSNYKSDDSKYMLYTVLWLDGYVPEYGIDMKGYYEGSCIMLYQKG